MSNGHEFFQTAMGRRFYESTMPDIATALLRNADRLEHPAKAEPASRSGYVDVPIRVEVSCYCKRHNTCPGGDCDACSDCPTGKARSILVAMGLA